jgi:hypothetical protein
MGKKSKLESTIAAFRKAGGILTMSEDIKGFYEIFSL